VALSKRAGRPLAWRNDPVILQTIDVAMGAWSEARPFHEQFRIVNAWRVEHGYPTISERTLRSYKQHAVELYMEQAAQSSEERVAEHNQRHKHLIRKLYDEIAASSDEKAKAIMYGHLQRTISEMPKYDGTTVIHVQQTVEHKSENEEAQILVQVLIERYGDEAATVLAEARKRIAGPPGEVIDVEAKEVATLS
jgi:hypothetical protein